MTCKKNILYCPHCGHPHKREYANNISINGLLKKDYSQNYVICPQNGEAYLVKNN